MSNTELQTQIIDAFNFRHACKVFDPSRKISDEEFNTILEAARLSPSSFGLEPWQILMIQTPEKRELFREFTWGANGAASGTDGQLSTASHYGIILAHTDETMAHHSDYSQQHLKEIKQLPDDIRELYNGFIQKFQEVDFQIEGHRQMSDWSARQAYIALGNMMTVAAMMGIDSCPIEGFEIEPASKVLEEHFGVDLKRYRPAVMFSFGYRADDPKRDKTRRAMDDVVSWF